MKCMAEARSTVDMHGKRALLLLYCNDIQIDVMHQICVYLVPRALQETFIQLHDSFCATLTSSCLFIL